MPSREFEAGFTEKVTMSTSYNKKDKTFKVSLYMPKNNNFDLMLTSSEYFEFMNTLNHTWWEYARLNKEINNPTREENYGR